MVATDELLSQTLGSYSYHLLFGKATYGPFGDAPTNGPFGCSLLNARTWDEVVLPTRLARQMMAAVVEKPFPKAINRKQTKR